MRAQGVCISTLVIEEPGKEEIGPLSGLLGCRMGLPAPKQQGPSSSFVRINVVGSQFSQWKKTPLTVKVVISVFWAALTFAECTVGSDIRLAYGGEEKPGWWLGK